MRDEAIDTKRHLIKLSPGDIIVSKITGKRYVVTNPRIEPGIVSCIDSEGRLCTRYGVSNETYVFIKRDEACTQGS